MVQQVCDDQEQFCNVERLGKVSLIAGEPVLASISRPRERCQRQRRSSLAPAFTCPQSPHELVAGAICGRPMR